MNSLDQKYLEGFKMWYCRRMEKTSWTVRAKNEEVLFNVKKENHILRRQKRERLNWINHILHKNFLLKHVIEGA